MNVSVNQKKLAHALRIVEKIVSKNASLPILGNVLLKTDGNNLKLSTTNLEVGINYWIGAKIDNPGEVAVPARIFSDFIGNISDEKVTLTSDNNVVLIDSEHYQTKILGMDTKEFPIIPKINKTHTFKINGNYFKDSLNSVITSSSLTETRPELSGVFVCINNNSADFAATDSFRLSEKIVNLNSDINKSFILPKNTALEIARILENMDKEINVSVSDNQVFVYCEDFELVSRLIDGRYPDYKKIIPNKFISFAKINREELERSIRMASIFSSTISDIKLKAEKNKLDIYAKNSDRGEIKASVACELKNQPFEIAVNYSYLLDGLKNMRTDNVLIEFTGEGSPLVIRGENLNDQTYIIMPLRN